MAKTLLQNLTGKTEDHDNTMVVPDDAEHATLSTLMQEMKTHLQHAAEDLLQPRAEAIEQLLQKAKSLH